ncbi:hypothetical protein RF11_09836 [Thelohanellus kitauei]|uniref:Uncharacterized protein n=1 Tax=Thelohanellus kitauei TaxID=669202 RepID=A0A0C2M8K9_THEKT|nr:hypothetical protein RF11_09836 [Thelohanellus kitauei]
MKDNFRTYLFLRLNCLNVCPPCVMNELGEEYQDPSTAPVSSQSITRGMFLIQISIPPAAVYCEMDRQRFGHFEFPRPAQGLVDAFSRQTTILFKPVGLRNSVLQRYMVTLSIRHLT